MQNKNFPCHNASGLTLVNFTIQQLKNLSNDAISQGIQNDSSLFSDIAFIELRQVGNTDIGGGKIDDISINGLITDSNKLNITITTNFTLNCILTDLLNDSWQRMNIKIESPYDNKLYYGVNCNYNYSSFTIDDFTESNYILNYHGWNNGSCPYTTYIVDSVIGRVLLFNTSSCVSNIRKDVSMYTNGNIFDIEFMLNVYNDNRLYFNAYNTSFSEFFSLYFQDNQTSWKKQLFIYDGGVYKQVINYSMFNNYWIKIHFDNIHHNYKLYSSSSFASENYELIFAGSLYNEVSLIEFNPFAGYSSDWNFPSWIDSIIITTYPNLPVYNIYNDNIFYQCNYTMANNYHIRVYGTTEYSLNDYTQYTDLYSNIVECSYNPTNPDVKQAIKDISSPFKLVGYPLYDIFKLLYIVFCFFIGIIIYLTIGLVIKYYDVIIILLSSSLLFDFGTLIIEYSIATKIVFAILTVIGILTIILPFILVEKHLSNNGGGNQ